MAILRLTSDHIKSHLFNGGFRPMEMHDKFAYCDADNGSLIANIYFGRYRYEVIFSPVMGNVQIFEYDEMCFSNCWEMDLNTGKYIKF